METIKEETSLKDYLQDPEVKEWEKIKFPIEDLIQLKN